MHFAPIRKDDKIIAILQTARDVTEATWFQMECGAGGRRKRAGHPRMQPSTTDGEHTTAGPVNAVMASSESDTFLPC